MKVEFASTTRRTSSGDVCVEFVASDQLARIKAELTPEELPRSKNAMVHLREAGMLYVGLGDPARVDANSYRSAAGAAAMFLRTSGRRRAVFNLSREPGSSSPVVEGAMLGNYRFEAFKPAKEKPLKQITIRVLADDLAKARATGLRSQVIAGATNFAREIGNQPGNVIYPKSLAAAADAMAKEKGLKATVFDEKELKRRGFRGVLAVGGGSSRAPRVIVLEHRGGRPREAVIALVGKAVTFDTGGLSIKPAANMEEMIFDKSGGIAVLGAMAAIADLHLPQNVVGIVASAENMPSSTAYRPGDIITAFDGKHIEIVNTDAEGRVVLADAIAYARQVKKASAIINLATLTGACGVALGEAAAGLWSSSDVLRDGILNAANAVGERVWPMPLFDEYHEQIRSKVALVKNSGGRLAGACTAAAFLKVFAEETPWAHLDIAYKVSLSKDSQDLTAGATGFGVRTLVEFIAAHACNAK